MKAASIRHGGARPWLAWAIAAGCAVTLLAQTPTAPVPPRPPVPPDRDAFNKALAIKDPGAQMAAIIQYVADFPDSETAYFAVARGMRIIGEADKNDLTRLTALVHQIEAIMPRATEPYRRADVYYTMAYRLLNRGILVADAERLALKSVPLLDEAEFLAIEKKTHEERQASLSTRTPSRETDPFPVAEAQEKFRGTKANHLSALGRAYLMEGRIADAEKPLLESYHLAPVMETGLALSEIRESTGRNAEALEFAVAAALTGKMTAKERAKLDAIYRKTHDGSTEGLEAYLDATFRKTHVNPIAVKPYHASKARTDRTVLLEMVTGAACVPCLAVDLSLEAELQRYTRQEVALVVYHIHAPTSDPYGNASVEARTRYYDIRSAPTVYVDGTVASVGEGSTPLANEVFAKLEAAVATRLESPSQSTIGLTASLVGGSVRAEGTVTGVRDPSRVLRLQVALVESETSYSGENGLRFQPMVVRNLIGDGDTRGLEVNPSQSFRFTHHFDLEKITAENLAYYDWYVADLKKRTSIDAVFREKKHVMNSENLAVVAFLQDDTSHEILQSAYAPVASAAAPRSEQAPSTPVQPITWSLRRDGEPSQAVAAGSRFTVALTAAIDTGWHLYALEQMEAGPLATKIVAGGPVFAPGGEVASSPPHVAFDPNFNAQTMFFEDEATFTVPVSVDARAKPGSYDLRITATYQMCSRTTCLPPREETVTAKVTVIAKR